MGVTLFDRMSAGAIVMPFASYTVLLAVRCIVDPRLSSPMEGR